MDPKWQTLFFALAILFVLLGAKQWRPRRAARVPEWTPLGLACFFVPFLYGAIVAGW